MHARVVLADLPAQATQVVADRFVHTGCQHDQRNLPLRNTLGLLAVPQKSAPNQLCQVPRLQCVGRSLEFDQRDAVQERHQHGQIAPAGFGQLPLLPANQENIDPQRQPADEHLVPHGVSRGQLVVQQPCQQRVPPGSGLSRPLRPFGSNRALWFGHGSSLPHLRLTGTGPTEEHRYQVLYAGRSTNCPENRSLSSLSPLIW